MAHKTLIGGTAYEITGGKTLVDGTAYSIKSGKTLVDGTAYEVGFSGWPSDLDTGLEFISSSAFAISVASPGWNGTMEYCNGEGWQTWDGNEISSGENENGQCIYIRGIGNRRVAYANAVKAAWSLTGSDIACNGNIEKLLDYSTVTNGAHPAMDLPGYAYMFYGCTSLTSAPSLPATTAVDYCYDNMFYGCTSLTSAPSLPATTLGSSCYRNMFYGCISLTSLPSLPATTLRNYCYYGMFCGCTGIKMSETQTDEYRTAYRIPTSGTGTEATNALKNMFTSTGGTFTGTPTINTTYYLDSSNTIV